MNLLIEIIALAFITTYAIFGIHAVTREGELFGFVERWWGWETNEHKEWEAEFVSLTKRIKGKNKALGELGCSGESGWVELAEERDALIEEKKLLQKYPPAETHKPSISKPLTECPLCMSSIWGTIAVFTYGLTHWTPTITLGLWVPFMLTVAGVVAAHLWVIGGRGE